MTRKDIVKLKERVLECGGKRFQKDEYLEMDMPPELVKKLLKSGKCEAGKNAKRLKVGAGRCHENTAYLAVNEGHKACTGLALSNDGIWRVHSWARDKGTGQLIETTERRTKYFGICGTLDDIGLDDTWEDFDDD